MADVNWREAGFLAQTTGNYPDASDVADKDNIFLTESGWVYRHFRDQAKTKFWDEIIWAGYVDDAVVENDPVDEMNEATADVTFLVGDGFQYVEGPYPEPGSLPATDPVIGTVGVTGSGTAVDGESKSYTVAVSGGTASNFTYTWSATGGSVASGQGSTTASIAFSGAGNASVKCSVASSDAGVTNSPQEGTKAVVVSAAPAPPATGPVTGITMTGTTSSQADGNYTGQNTTSDNGSGLTVDYDVASYVVSNVSVNDAGSGYEQGDEFTIVGTGGTAKGTVSI